MDTMQPDWPSPPAGGPFDLEDRDSTVGEAAFRWDGTITIRPGEVQAVTMD